MRYATFRIPVHTNADGPAEELNRFLSSNRILSAQREFLADGEGSAWCFLVGYGALEEAPSRAKAGTKDYRQVLAPAQFQIYARLRSLRKEIALREAVAPYIVFTNEQLATMVTEQVRDKAGIAAIPGIGPARLEKYAAEFLTALVDLQTSPEGKGDPRNEA